MATAYSLAGLMEWSRRAEWLGPFNEVLDRHVGAVCAKMGVTIEELPELIGDHFSVLWGCVFEDFLARDLDDGRNVVDHYLKRRGWKESASNKAYMMALRSSVMSLYEVSGIVRDESFLARDLVRGGEPVRVSERMGTHYLKPWDRIAARIVKIGAANQMAGGALPFDYNVSEAVLMALRRAGGKARKEADKLAREIGRSNDKAIIDAALSETEILRASAFVFTNFWLDDVLERVLNRTLPRMCNTDGDELVFTTVRYPLNSEATVPAIGAALAAIPALRPESETVWNWVELRKLPRRKRKDSHTFVTTLGDGSTVLGTVELKDGALVLETNSPQRAARGRALIEPVLGGLAGRPLVESRTPEELMTSPPAKRSRPPSSGLTPDAERAVIHAYLDEHYLSLLDEPVAMLGNVTPRQAAKTAKGRAKLVTWLKYLENSAARHKPGDPMAGYDFAWLWETLGITALRR